MKLTMRTIFFILSFFPGFCIGQNLSIQVIDADSKETLPYANIYFQKSGIGTSTDEQGIGQFKIASLLANDTINVSYIGYESVVWVWNKEASNDTVNISLPPSSLELAEVIVKYEKPLKPIKVIKSAIMNTALNYPTKDVIYKNLYRETIKENGKYIQLNEAVLKNYSSSYPQKKLDKTIWKDWNFDESYAFDLEGDLLFQFTFHDYNTKADHQTVLASRYSKSLSQYGFNPVLRGDPLLLYAFDKIKYQYDFFNPSLLKKYNFKHEKVEMVDGEPCYVISFVPKKSNRKFHVDQSKKNKRAIYVGRLHISKSSFALVKFQFKLAVDRNYGFFKNRIPLDYQVGMKFKKNDGLYYVDKIHLRQAIKVGNKENGEAIILEAEKDLRTLSIQKDNVLPFADSIRFKSTIYTALRCYMNNYDPAYWDSLEIADSLKLSPKLIADLGGARSLAEQFDELKIQSKKELPAPSFSKRHHVFDYHDRSLVDSLHWMASPDNEIEFRKYLSDENNYASNELVEERNHQKKIFDQLNTFYAEPSDSPKIEIGKYFFREDSLDHEIYCFQKDSLNTLKVLDLTEFKDEHENIFIKNIMPNQAQTMVLVEFEKAGYIGDWFSVLPFGENRILDEVSNSYTVEWYTDSTYLYTKTNDIGRAGSLMLRDVKSKTESLIFTEADPVFDVEVIKSNDEFLCTVQSKIENEVYLITENHSKLGLKLLKKRVSGMTNSVRVKDGIYFLVDDEKEGSYIEYIDKNDLDQVERIVSAKKGDYIEDFLPVQDKIVVQVYEESIPKIRYYDLGNKAWMDIDTDLGIGQYYIYPLEHDGNGFGFAFSSLSIPSIKYEYNFKTSELKEVSKAKLKKPAYAKFNKIKREWARSHDGQKIPITLVKNTAAYQRNAGLILKVYGAYGAITIPYFDAQEAILLQEGYTIAYAHVRGESLMGANWYKSGRTDQKMNGILDYLACAEYLIKKGITSSELLIGYGNSAGGLIVGQAINLRPELFNKVVLDHPYLDVVNTMMDEKLPLTIDEYREWGNPKEEAVYQYILKYSPYQNIKKQNYPEVLLMAGYEDWQAPIWQVAKYTAKLREHNLSDNKIIMFTDMRSGHIGNTSGKEWIKKFANMSSFISR